MISRKKSPASRPGLGAIRLSDQPKDSARRESDTRPDSAAIKVLDRYRFKFNQLTQQESDFVVKQMLGNLIALCEELADLDRVCRIEWQSDGKMFTPDFILGVLLPNALAAISEHERTFRKKERPKWLDVGDWLHLGNRFEEEIRPLKDDLEKAYTGEADEPARHESQPRPFDGQEQTAPEPAKATAKTPKCPDGLGRKKTDLSHYFDAADLTERQRECASLSWEYGLGVTEIARRLGLGHHSTVQESLDGAKRRLERDENFKRALKKAAAHRSSDESN